MRRRRVMIGRMSSETGIKKLFTIEEFMQIEAAGVFPPDSRFELIRGEIIEMPWHSWVHMGRVNKLNRVFTSRLGESVVVSVQNEVHIPDLKPMSRPKPDVALLKPLPEFFGPWAPVPDEVLLLVEISDTSLRYDRTTKTPLYAEAGIQEYWILNIVEQVLEVYAEPVNGEYRRTQILKPGDTITLQALPAVTFAVDDILK